MYCIHVLNLKRIRPLFSELLGIENAWAGRPTLLHVSPEYKQAIPHPSPTLGVGKCVSRCCVCLSDETFPITLKSCKLEIVLKQFNNFTAY